MNPPRTEETQPLPWGIAHSRVWAYKRVMVRKGYREGQVGETVWWEVVRMASRERGHLSGDLRGVRDSWGHEAQAEGRACAKVLGQVRAQPVLETGRGRWELKQPGWERGLGEAAETGGTLWLQLVWEQTGREARVEVGRPARRLL